MSQEFREEITQSENSGETLTLHSRNFSRKTSRNKFRALLSYIPEERGSAKFHQTFFTANSTVDCTKEIPAEVLLTLYRQQECPGHFFDTLGTHSVHLLKRSLGAGPDPVTQCFSKTTALQVGKECDTNERCTTTQMRGLVRSGHHSLFSVHERMIH